MAEYHQSLRYVIEGESLGRASLAEARAAATELSGVARAARFRLLGQSGLNPTFFELAHDDRDNRLVAYVSSSLVPYLCTLGRGAIIPSSASRILTHAVNALIGHATFNHAWSVENGLEQNFYGTHAGAKYADWSCGCPLHLAAVFKASRDSRGARTLVETPIGLNPQSFVDFVTQPFDIYGIGKVGKQALRAWATAIEIELDGFDYYRSLC
ncbi:hypothetical protein KC878_00905 [Candidatus Saccharibacteria bacterium]|nr:hypothetical protein [Candidatus Saccharibacteria bacterium]MCB9821574.1 hypothetical protein [Candidatus Nomurabacteria bacterium]